MLKNILNLEGALQLSKNEQKEISGGRPKPGPGLCLSCENNDGICPTGYTWAPPISGSVGNGSCCPNQA